MLIYDEKIRKFFQKESAYNTQIMQYASQTKEKRKKMKKIKAKKRD